MKLNLGNVLDKDLIGPNDLMQQTLRPGLFKLKLFFPLIRVSTREVLMRGAQKSLRFYYHSSPRSL